MIGDDKNIGGTEIDQRTDIKAKTEIGDDTDKVSNKNEQDELVEPDRLLPFRWGIVIPEAGIDDVLIERLDKHEGVAHGIRIRVFSYPFT